MGENPLETCATSYHVTIIFPISKNISAASGVVIQELPTGVDTTHTFARP